MATEIDDVRIKVFASPRKQWNYDVSDENRIIEVIREQVLPGEKAPYHSINIKIKRQSNFQPEYLIAYMMRKDIYSAEVKRINIDRQYNVTEIINDFDDRDDFDDEETIGTGATYSHDEVFDFVVATPVPEIYSSLEAAESIRESAERAGLRVKMLTGPEASVANYKHYLQMGPKGFVSIGHGYKGGIVLDDGRLRYTWFQGLTDRPLSPSVIYFNSGKVFNTPLLPQIMNAGARSFIGGILNLLIGHSEKVCQAFWERIFNSRDQMGIVLKDVERKHYPLRGAHAAKGDFGPFRADKKIGIMAANNRFICAENGGGAELNANRPWIRRWETFNLYYLAPDQVALQASNNQYLCAEGGGGHELVVNRNQIGTWETFTIRKKEENQFALQAFNGQYVCAEENGKDPLTANRSETGPWETFEFIPVRRIGLIARNGKYVCAEGGGGRELFADRDWLRSWETFIMAELGYNKVALQSFSGTYVCAEDGGAHNLMANRNWIHTWEIFTMEKITEQKIALKACNGRYINAIGTDPLNAGSIDIGANEIFTLVEIDGNIELEFSAKRQEYIFGHI